MAKTLKVVGLTVMSNGRKKEVPFTKTTRDLSRKPSRRIPRAKEDSLPTMDQHVEATEMCVEVEGD